VRSKNCPASDDEDPWLISALPQQRAARTFERDLETISRFNERHSHAQNGLAIIDVIELKADSAKAIDATLDLINDSGG
jgi:hypothetical protein